MREDIGTNALDVTLLYVVPSFQIGADSSQKGDAAARIFTFDIGKCEFRAVSRRIVLHFTESAKGATDIKYPAGQVDVFPAQTTDLADTQAGDECQTDNTPYRCFRLSSSKRAC